jgi:hypothetical protein
MYWNISAILCCSAKRASRSAIILASISCRSNGTLNQGYLLLRYEGAAPVRHPQVIRRAAPTTWQGKIIRPGCIDGSGPPRDTGPLYGRVRSYQEGMPGPSSRLQNPPCADQALAGSRDEEDPGMSRGPEPARV